MNWIQVRKQKILEKNTLRVRRILETTQDKKQVNEQKNEERYLGWRIAGQYVLPRRRRRA